jgi:3-oxoacyl-[acyl-carrier-protein] synthase-3
MPALPVRILGTGKALPATAVTADDMDRRLGLAPGTVAKQSGVLTRYFVDGETTSSMGAQAARAALEAAGIEASDLDAIVGVCGGQEQAIPCTASLVQKALGLSTSGIPSFDVNSTCLSFVTGLDVVSHLIASGRYERVLLVASEIASVGLNWNDRESATIMGDGAAAAVIGRAKDGETSRIFGARMETYSEGSEMTRLRAGGTRYHPRQASDLKAYVDEYALFEMDGKSVFKFTSQKLPGFVERFFEQVGSSLSEVDMVLPHQASPTAMWLVQRRLGVAPEKFMVIAPEFGNTIAASIPMALHEAISRGKLKRGDRAMLLGTSAGFSMGALLFEY